MAKLKLIHIVIFYFLLSVQANTQFRSGVVKYYPEMDSYFPIEQILLETDRQIYMAGEEIQFSCFTYEPVLQKRIELSRIVYVEFFTSNNLVVKQIKIEMEKGYGNGYIEIPKRVSSGKYYIRAYTNYMKNYGCAGFAYSSVTVLNPFIPGKEDNDDMTSALKRIVVHPDGGSIISNSLNKIVCEFTDESGYPISGMGRLLDNSNKIITTFTTDRYGLGSFSFTPLPGNHYRVEATAVANILEKKIEIPEASVKLDKTEQNNEYVQFNIQQYQYTAFPLQLKVYFAGYDMLLRELNRTDSSLTVRLIDLPKGLIQFTLENNSGEILSAQTILNYPIQASKIRVTTNKDTYGNREKLLIKLEDLSENINESEMSVSVFLIRGDNLQEYLDYDRIEFLESVLYPFLGGTPFPVDKVIQDNKLLEQVLIARSKSGFSERVLNASKYEDLVYFPEICNDLLFGKVTNELGNPIASAPLIQTWIDTVSTMETVVTNERGMFYLPSDRKGEQELIITHSKHNKGNISLQDEFYPEFFSLAKEDIMINPAYKKVYKQQMLNVQINDSYRNGKSINDDEPIVPFYIEPDKTFFINDYIPLPTLEEFLFEVVPGILPIRTKGKTAIRLPIAQNNFLFGDDPLFLVDGVPLFDEKYIVGLNCSELLSVGVVYEKFFFQHETFDGIIDIHSRKGDASIITIPEDRYAESFTGIQSLKVKSAINDNSRAPYFKTQLYWNPSVTFTDKVAHLNHMTPDNTGYYLIRSSVKKPNGTIESFYSTFQVTDKEDPY